MAEGLRYILSSQQILQRLEMLRDFLAKFPIVSDIFYSQKTNNLPSIAQILLKHGCGVEVVSFNELLQAIEDGFDKERIIYNGVAKSYKDLEFAISQGICIHVDSYSELEKIIKITEEKQLQANIGLRLQHIYQGNISALREKVSKFGLSTEEALAIIQLTQKHNINIKGVHFNVGTNILSSEPYLQQLRYITIVLEELFVGGNNNYYINIGGGIPCSSAKENYEVSLSEIYESVLVYIMSLAKNKLLRVIFEPGRFLFEESGTLSTQIIDIKTRDYADIIFLNASITDINSIHTWHHNLKIGQQQVSTHKLLEQKQYFISGYNCFEGDYLQYNFKSDKILNIGDELIFRNVGGYDLMSSRAWTRLRPEIYLTLDDTKPAVVVNYRKHKDLLKFPPLLVIDKEITIRRVQLLDAPHIFDIIERNRELFSATMDWVKNTKKQLDVEHFIIRESDAFNLDKEYTYSIYYYDKVVGLYTLRNEGENMSIGYYLDSALGGLGIMGRVVKYTTNYVQEYALSKHLYIRCAVDNIKSNQVPKRAGYVLVGILPQGERINDIFHNQNIYVNAPYDIKDKATSN